MSSEAAPTNTVPAIRRFVQNLRAVPQHFTDSLVRSGKPTTDRSRSSFIFGNLFFHLHSVPVHRCTLRWATTWGLGIMSAAVFFLTLGTGILLMFYYKPYPE